MAAFSVPSRRYAAGTYGPFKLDALLDAGFNTLRVTITQGGNQAVGNPVAKVTVMTDAGNGAIVPINSPFRKMDGTPSSTNSFAINLPSNATSATATLEVLTAVTCAVKLEAV